MQLKKTMRFYLKRFHHFLAIYFAFGLAATLTHGAIVMLSLDAIASESETEQVAVELETDLATEVTSEAPVNETVIVDESLEIVPEEVVEETLDNQTELAEPEVVTETTPIENVDVVPESEPQTEVPVTETPPEQPVENTEIAPEETAVEEERIDSWPEERTNTDPVYVEESLPPYSEVRSTLEAVTPKLDWLYTLRAEAKYTEISILKTQTAIDMGALATTLENNGADSVIQQNFCTLDADLSLLTDFLAPGSDDTQPEVDAANLEVLSEINIAVQQIREIWMNVSGSSNNCN